MPTICRYTTPCWPVSRDIKLQIQVLMTKIDKIQILRGVAIVAVILNFFSSLGI